MRKWLAGTVLVCAAMAAGCRKTHSKAAVEAAIRNHLSHNSHLMLNAFTTHFEKVTLHSGTAKVVVKYQSKNMPGVAVEVTYGLKKTGGQWQIVSSSSTAGQLANPANPHGGTMMDQMPAPAGPPEPVPSH